MTYRRVSDYIDRSQTTTLTCYKNIFLHVDFNECIRKMLIFDPSHTSARAVFLDLNPPIDRKIDAKDKNRGSCLVPFIQAVSEL
jgi:hypothetical protein